MLEIDKYAGFCFGVTKAIKSAETELSKYGCACCLGKIVHNQKEEARLQDLGLKTISKEEMLNNPPFRMMIRAHGEPPETYQEAQDLNITIIDETCPVVLKLQQMIAESYRNNPKAQIVIFGKKGHAEVNGLVGQTNGDATVISSSQEIEKLNFDKKIILFSQTTADYVEFEKVVAEMQCRSENVEIHPTICGSVNNRIPRLQEFCKSYDVILFVSDVASSNGKMLYDVCLHNNRRSYFVTDAADVNPEWLKDADSIGISGANSTPLWLLEDIKLKCEEIIKR